MVRGLLVATVIASLASCGGGDGGSGGMSPAPVTSPQVVASTSDAAVPTQTASPLAGTPITSPAPISPPESAMPAQAVPTGEVVGAPQVVPAPAPQSTSPAAVQPVVSNVTLSGKITYDFVPNLTGPLLYASTVAKPVRVASVRVVDANDALLATTTTNDRGAYEVVVPARTSLKVRVVAQTVRAGVGAAAGWDVSVSDNTMLNALYSLDSPAFTSGTAALTHDLHAASGWGGKSYDARRMAAPFAVMDSIYTAMLKVMSVAPATQFPPLKVFWSVNNRATHGDKTAGDIGNSHHARSPTGSEIYVLGKEGVDTDEFDASVIVHEWGHYYQAAFSRNDTPGGGHGDADRLDARLAFAEGWGNGWSGIALERTNYTDSSEAGQQRGSSLELETEPVKTKGWYSEESLQWILWTLNARVGFKPIHDVMTSERFKGGTAFTTIHAFAAAFNAIAPTHMPTLGALLRAQNINDAPNDPFGLLETNAGGLPPVPDILPMHVEVQVGVVKSACLSNVGGSPNKVGNYRFFHFTATATGEYVEALATKSADASLELDFYRGGVLPKYRRGGSLVPFVQLTAGKDYLVSVRDTKGTEACFDLTINQQ
jgi:hypothetical protein